MESPNLMHAAAAAGLAVERLPPLSPLVLTIPASLATALLLLHSVRYRGLRETMVFCVVCVAWYLPKEYAIVARAIPLHTYTVTADLLTIGGVPLLLPIGYVFTGYVSWYLAERITDHLPGCRDRLFPVVVVWLCVASGIAYVMEVTGSAAHWWRWEVEDGGVWWRISVADRIIANADRVHPLIPDGPVYGWPLYMLPFAVTFLAFETSPLRRIRVKPAVYAMVLLVYFLGSLAQGLFLAIMLLVAAALFSRLPIRPRRGAFDGRWRIDPLLRHAPALALAAMLATAFYVVVIRGRDVTLLQSWIPLLTFVALACAGRHTLAVLAGLFVVLLAIDRNVSPRVYHACLYTGFLLAMCAVRWWRERAPAPAPGRVGARVAAWLVRGAPFTVD